MKDWMKTVAAVAPTLATALGGPMAGMAVKIAANALGIKPDEHALIEAVAGGDPNVLANLKHAENNLKVELKRLEVDLEKLHQKDRSSARKMATSTTIWPQIILATAFLSAFFWLLYALFSGDVSLADGMRDIGMMLIGVLITTTKDITAFFFGSSAGSKEKTSKLGHV